MKKEIIYTPNAPEPGPYPQAVKSDNLLFLAGQTADDPVTNLPVQGSVADQTERILKNIQAILEEAGSSLEKVLRCDVDISSMNVKEEMNAVYKQFFPKNPPAINCVQNSKI